VDIRRASRLPRSQPWIDHKRRQDKLMMNAEVRRKIQNRVPLVPRQLVDPHEDIEVAIVSTSTARP
jgi:hypothetical protein